MTDLLRSSSHGNGVSVLYVSDGPKIHKIADSFNGNSYLKNDFAGIKWYARQAKLQGDAPVLHTSSEMALLKIPMLDGARVSVEAPLVDTAVYVKRALDHYAQTWPRENRVPYHGDLTLDNVLFTDVSVRFFDWEHFDDVGLFWGFDAMYLALSSIFLPHLFRQQKFQPSPSVEKIWRTVADMGVDRQIMVRPLTALYTIFSTDARWADIVASSPRKLFPMQIDPQEIKRVDDYFERVLLSFD